MRGAPQCPSHMPNRAILRPLKMRLDMEHNLWLVKVDKVSKAPVASSMPNSGSHLLCQTVKKAKMFVCFTGDRLIVSYNGENKFNGRSWMIFHQPASQLHLIPPFIHSPASWVMIAAWCLGGGGGPKASGGGETATSSHFLPHFETFFLAANLPCFPTSCPTKARGRPVNESINGEPPTSLPVKVRNCLFSSFCLFLQ